MKIKSDLLTVTNSQVSISGDRIEPEQQVVRRVIQTDAAVTTTGGGSHGALASSIVVETPAHEVASAFARPCRHCKHFDQKRWNKWVEKADAPMAPMPLREAVNEIRGALLMTSNASVRSAQETPDGDHDVESAIKTLGFCAPLGEFVKDPMTVVHPFSCCPQETLSKQRPQGFYVPRDLDTKRQNAVDYDEVMKAAAGKVT